MRVTPLLINVGESKVLVYRLHKSGSFFGDYATHADAVFAAKVFERCGY